MDLVPNTFTTYSLTDHESLAAMRFSDLNRVFLQNLLATTSEELLNLEFHPETPYEFATQKIYKDGQISMLRYLLDVSSPAPAVTNQDQE